MKRQPPEWEIIIPNEATDKGLTSKIYKQLMGLNIKQNKTKNHPIKKYRLRMTFLQRSHTDGQKKKNRKKRYSTLFITAAAAKPLQSCLTLSDPTDGSPPGSAVPGILQARTLEWVAILLLQCMKLKSESEVAQSCPTLSDPMVARTTRLLHPWDLPGKSTGMGCHCLLRLLITREMQIKTAMSYHFILVRMVIIKISTNNKC